MKSVDLDDAVEAWLARGSERISLRFPPVLEALFAEETAPQKLRELKASTLMGVLAGFVFAPAFWFLMADARGMVLVSWLGVAVPAGLLCHALLRTRLPVRWQEWQTAFSGVVVAASFTMLVTSTKTDTETIYFGGMLLLIMLDVIAGGFSVWLGAGFAGVLVLMFGIAVQSMPDSSQLHGLVETGLMGFCSVFAVFGAWRLEMATRRSYALMLRERLKQRELASHNSELVELASRDALTGLANRRAYEVAEQASWRFAAEARIPVGLIVVDIDHFKSYNDFYGHPAGDSCLRAVARCLGETLRGTDDVVARVGGEEFAILLPDLAVETAGDIAERVRQAVAAMELPHMGCGMDRIVTVSCGACSLVPQPGGSQKDLFAAADAALYAAKQGGRNRVCLADMRLADAQADPGGLREVAGQKPD